MKLQPPGVKSTTILQTANPNINSGNTNSKNKQSLEGASSVRATMGGENIKLENKVILICREYGNLTRIKTLHVKLFESTSQANQKRSQVMVMLMMMMRRKKMKYSLFVYPVTGCSMFLLLNLLMFPSETRQYRIMRAVSCVHVSLQVSVMITAAGLSCVAAVFISAYSCLTLTYGEEDKEVFHHHDSPQVVSKALRFYEVCRHVVINTVI